MIGEPGRARFDGRSRPPAVPRFLARIVAALVAALLGALTALAAVSGSAEVGSAETVYTYSDHPRSSVLTRAMSERGPPAYDLNAETANDAVDRWSRGAPARSNGPATTTTYTYYRPALAQTTCGGRAAIEVVGDPGMACVVVQPLSVAANSVPRLSATFGSDGAIANMSKWAARHPEPGYYDVIGHGSPNSVAGMSADELAAKLAQSSGGQNIRLLSCQTACPSGSFAQDLANKMGVRVMAPTTDIGASGSGKTLTFFDGGEWRWFDPN